MSEGRGPWDLEPEPQPARAPPLRLILWLVCAAALVALVVALAKAFPEANLKAEDWTQVAYLCGFLVLLSAGAVRLTRDRAIQHLRHAAIWAVIVAVAALVFAYRGELAGVPRRLQLAFSNGDPVAMGEHELAIPRSDGGHYLVVGLVNGERVRFLIDTGASDTVLSPADAQRLGISPGSLRFDRLAETANGTGYGAAWTADRLEVGGIRLTDFPVTVNQAPMSTSLLGMSFLNRLEAFEFRGGQLILKWRGAP